MHAKTDLSRRYRFETTDMGLNPVYICFQTHLQ